MMTESGVDQIGNKLYVSKGFGFVCFEDAASAAKVYHLAPGSLKLNNNQLTVNFFEPKDIRKKKLKNTYDNFENSDKANQLSEMTNMFQQFFSPMMQKMMGGMQMPMGGGRGGMGGHFNRGFRGRGRGNFHNRGGMIGG